MNGAKAETVLVTGAGGFVGRHLVPFLLDRGYSVRAATRQRGAPAPSAAEFFTVADLGEAPDWPSRLDGVSSVVHLAAIAHKSGIPPERYDSVNHRATVDLAQAASRAGVRRFVFVSSVGAQIGPCADGVVTEELPPAPAGPYGRSKLAAERSLAGLPLETVILRPVLVYGRGAPGNMGQLVRLARRRWPLPFGAIRNRRSLVAVENLLEAIAWGLADPQAPRQTVLVSDTTPLSLAEMVTALRRGLGRDPLLLPVPPALFRGSFKLLGLGDMWDRLAGDLAVSNEKLTSLGWKPVIDTPEGLVRLAASL